MKKLIYIIFVTFPLFGCSSFKYSIENIKPNEYGLDDSFNNRVFYIHCSSNSNSDRVYIKKTCLTNISTTAKKSGYDYFTILNEKDGSEKYTGSYTIDTPISTYSNSTFSDGKSTFYGTNHTTSYIPQTHLYEITKVYKRYLFILITKNELKKYKNYYKVSDYIA